MWREFEKGKRGEVRAVPIFGPEDFANVGSGAGNLLKGLGGAVANAACGLYKDYPRSFTGGLGDGNPVNQFNRGLWDNLCGSLPTPQLPAPPSRPFTGGQCSCVAYKVDYTYRVKTRSNGEEDVQNASAVFFGPLGGTSVVKTQVGVNALNEPVYDHVISIKSRGQVVFGCLPAGDYGLVTLTGISASVSITSVTKNDGTADECGSLEPDWPPDLAPPSNPGNYNYQPDDGGPPVPIGFNIGFDPTFNGPFVELPDIPNVCVGFELFGVNVDLCTNKPGDGGGSPDLGPLEDKLDELGDKLDDIGDGVDEGTNDENVEDGPTEPVADENGEPKTAVVKCVDNLRYVTIRLTKIPTSANFEKGLGGKDLVDDAGWVAFLVDGAYLPPQRIYWDVAVFEAPPGSTCYAVKLNFGFEASITNTVKSTE